MAIRGAYSAELERTLADSSWTEELSSLRSLEQAVHGQFDRVDPTKKWREGVSKTSFAYLLLDPRISDNLPCRADLLEPRKVWETFLDAVFYVGKGKRSRPYTHLYQAVLAWNSSGGKGCLCPKVRRILDIWSADKGVICLHVFQNVIPAEAYTREAAMIGALRLTNLCNAKGGDFYGVAATWRDKEKRLFGVYLLYRAMRIFLNEGERQLKPVDIE